MHIRLFACLLFLQIFAACQEQERLRSLTDNLDCSSGKAAPLRSEKAGPPAENIVFQSTDGGQTWHDASAGLPADTRPEAVFAGDGELFLSADDGLYRRSDRPLASPVWSKSLFLEGRVTDVFAGPKAVYASIYNRGVFQSLPGMDIWQPTGQTLPDKQVRTVLALPSGALLVGADSGIFKSADGGKTWLQVFDDGMILNLNASGNVLIGGGRAGVVRSTDDGEHWENVLDEHILAKQTGVIGDHFVAILGTEDPRKINPQGITQRLRTSADGGKTWQRIEQYVLPLQGPYPMDERLAQSRDLYDIVQLGQQLFCSFDTGIYRSSDQGKTWEPVFSLKEKGSFRLAVAGNVLYAVIGGGC